MGVEIVTTDVVEIYTEGHEMPPILGGHQTSSKYMVVLKGFSLFGLVIYNEPCKLTWREWENGPFEDVFSIEDGDFPASHVS